MEIVPAFFDWDQQSNGRVDRKRRPELNFGVVDYVAAQEYMVCLSLFLI